MSQPNTGRLVLLIPRLFPGTGRTAIFANDVLDAPYITYRYARNFARGHGLVWNPGDSPVEGYTTFLWAATIGLLMRSGCSPLLSSHIISFLSGIVLFTLAVFAST